VTETDRAAGWWQPPPLSPRYPCEVCGKETNGADMIMFSYFRHVTHPACHNSVMLRFQADYKFDHVGLRLAVARVEQAQQVGCDEPVLERLLEDEIRARTAAYMSWLAARDLVRDDLAATLKQINADAEATLRAADRTAGETT